MGEDDLDAGLSAALLDTMQKRTALVLIMLLNALGLNYLKQIKQVTFLFHKLRLISCMAVFMIESRQYSKLNVNRSQTNIFISRCFVFELK